jgi:hypothetical protein
MFRTAVARAMAVLLLALGTIQAQGALAAMSNIAVDLSTSVQASPIVFSVGCLTPPASIGGPGPDTYSYGAISITTGAGSHVLEITTLTAPSGAPNDPAILVYSGVFDPNSPATNLISCDDNGAIDPGLSPTFGRLVVDGSTTYTVVVLTPQDADFAGLSTNVTVSSLPEPLIVFPDKSVALGATGETMTATSNSAGAFFYSAQDPGVAQVHPGTGELTTNAVGTTQILAIQGIETGRYGSGLQLATLTVTGGSGAASMPTVTAAGATNLSANAATLHGRVESDGGAQVTERGVVYSTSNADLRIGGPGVTTKQTTGTTGDFAVDVTALSAGTSYWFKAYAVNSAGIGYSDAATFTTSTEPACASPYTQAGYIVNGCGANTPSGTSCSAQSCASGYTLLPGGVQGSVACSAGSYSGAFTGCSQAAAPTVTVQGATNLSANAATLHGRVESDGGAQVTERGVVYSTSNADLRIGGPGVTTKQTTGTTGDFAVDVTALSAGTSYWFKAYAINSAGIGYSDAATFTTSAEPACASPYTQAGYIVNGCGANTPSGTACTSNSCETGYSGAIQGSVSCRAGSYVGAFSGCQPLAERLEFTSAPAGAVAGRAFATQPVVEVRSSAGATVTSSAAAVHLSLVTSSVDGARVICTSNPVSAVSGRAAFDGCTIDKPGTYSLRATAAGLTEARTADFFVGCPEGQTPQAGACVQTTRRITVNFALQGGARFNMSVGGQTNTCFASCTQEFVDISPLAQTLTLQVEPSSGFQLTAWTGVCAGVMGTECTIQIGAGDRALNVGIRTESVSKMQAFSTLVALSFTTEYSSASVNSTTFLKTLSADISAALGAKAVSMEVLCCTTQHLLVISPKAHSDGAFFEALYRAALDRDADPAGLAFWVGLVESGIAPESVVGAMLRTPEFVALMEELLPGHPGRQEMNFLASLYATALLRFPDDAGLGFFAARLQSAQCRGDAQDEAAGVARFFFTSPEYRSRGRSNAAFVDDLYDGLLARLPDSTGRAFWISQLQAGATRDMVIDAFLGSSEFRSGVALRVAQESCKPGS